MREVIGTFMVMAGVGAADSDGLLYPILLIFIGMVLLRKAVTNLEGKERTRR